MIVANFLTFLILAITITTTSALSLPRFFRTNTKPVSISSFIPETAVSHLISLNKTLPTNLTYNDIFLYIKADLFMDLRVPPDNIWRPVPNLLCIKRMDFEPINGTIYPKNCSTYTIRNATNYGAETCMALDSMSWFIDFNNFKNINISDMGTGKLGHVCCGNGCKITDFHF